MKVEIFIQYQGDRYSQMLKLHQREHSGGASCEKLRTRLTKGVQRDLQELGLDEGEPIDVQFQWKYGKARSFWEVEADSVLHHRLQALLHGIHQRVRNKELESRSISSVTLKEDDKRVRMKIVAQRVKAREPALSSANVPQSGADENAEDQTAHISTNGTRKLALSISNNDIAALASNAPAPKPVLEAPPKRKRQESENQPDRADSSARAADPRRATKRAKLANAVVPVANPSAAASGSRDPRAKAAQGKASAAKDDGHSDEVCHLLADLNRVRAERNAAYDDNHKLEAQYRERFEREKAKFEAEGRRLREQIQAAAGHAAPHHSAHLARREKEALQAVWDEERQCLEAEIQELRDRAAGTATDHSADIIKKIKADHEFSLRQAVAAEHTRYAATITQLKRDLGMAQRELADARDTIERLCRETQAAHGELARMDAHHARLARLCADLRVQNEELEGARDEADALVRGLARELAECKKSLEERDAPVPARVDESREQGGASLPLEEQTGAGAAVSRDAPHARSRQVSAAGTAEAVVCKENVLALTQAQMRNAELECVLEEGEI
ncbi:hypothetical protein PsYK624_156010 [Phanerochaete sordida]|uniref:Uncharacterized protein n=1 Tax=Phanerochaete sordida TaxID=48140 RepID=A0A9P3GPI2_9APHY|nr:hypothetical protein PsYK624_156010 [Phanerochaete sordida]